MFVIQLFVFWICIVFVPVLWLPFEVCSYAANKCGIIKKIILRTLQLAGTFG